MQTYSFIVRFRAQYAVGDPFVGVVHVQVNPGEDLPTALFKAVETVTSPPLCEFRMLADRGAAPNAPVQPPHPDWKTWQTFNFKYGPS